MPQDLGSDPTHGPFYHQQLRRYYARFPRHMIQVRLYDDLRRDAAAVIRTMFRHLGVDAGFQPNTRRVANAGRLPRNRQLNTLLKRTALGRRIPARVNKRLSRLNSKPADKLSQEHRARLIDIFREDVLRLQDLIQRDLGHWLTA